MKKPLFIVALVALITTVNAEDKPVASATSTGSNEAGFQLSLTPDIAIHPKTITVKGLSLGIWSENPQNSLTLGIVNGSTGQSSGFSWAWGINYAESYTGVHWGLVNVSTVSFTGWQAGALNYSKGTFTGLQSGFVNVAEDATGVQFGCVNYSQKLRGVQIGFLNVATETPWFKEFPNKLAMVFPFVNWSF